MKETIINIYPITQFIIILFAIVGGYNVINNFLNILARYGKDKLDTKKDIHAKNCDADIIQDLIQKYPNVDMAFMFKNEKEQNIENNQEIHDLNKRVKKLEERK